MSVYFSLSPQAESSSVTSLESRLIGSVLLERRSLVLVQEEMYKTYLHGIQELTCDTLTQSIANIHLTQYKVGDKLTRGTRVSLTIRNVPNVITSRQLRNLFGKTR